DHHHLHRGGQHRLHPEHRGRHPASARAAGVHHPPHVHRPQAAGGVGGRGGQARADAWRDGAGGDLFRPAAGAGGRGLRRGELPDRRLRARDGHGLRGPQAVRPAPDHRGHAGRRRDHAGAADGPASVEDLRGHGGGLP
ncbi:MAG: GH4, partial [uncultured Rubellimicrobium sp.]